MSIPKIDYVKVAQLARQAFINGVSASALVAQHFNVSHKYACQLIMRARRNGHSVPKLPNNPVHKQITVRLVCTDCYTSFDISEAVRLKAHILHEHKRPAHREELIPKAA